MGFGIASASRAVVARNAGYNLVGQTVPVLVALLTLPVVVRGLGPAHFGLLALSWTLVGYFGLIDFGFGRAATQRIARLPTNEKDPNAVAAVAGTAVLFLALLGIAGGLVLWVGAGVFAGALVPGDPALRLEGERILRVLAFALPAVLVANAYRAVLEGLARFDLVNVVRAPFTTALFLIPAAGVVAGWSVVAIVVALVASRWAAAIVYHGVYARTRKGGTARFDTAVLSALAQFGGWVAISNVIIPAVVYLERVVVTAQRGPEALGYYAAPHELMLKLLVVPAALTSVLYPLFSAMTAHGNTPGLARGVSESTRLIALLVAPVIITLVLLAQPLLSVWLGPDHGTVGGGVLRLLATAAFLNSLALVPFVLLEGAGRPDLVAKYHLIELPFYALLLWFLVGQFGIVGAATAWLVRVSIMTPFLFALAFRLAGVSFADPASRRAVYAVLTGVIALLGAHMWSLSTEGSGALWFGLALPVLHAFVSWRWLLDAGERNTLLGALRRLTPARPDTAPDG